MNKWREEREQRRPKKGIKASRHQGKKEKNGNSNQTSIKESFTMPFSYKTIEPTGEKNPKVHAI